MSIFGKNRKVNDILLDWSIVRLILTLHVSMVTTKRSFSAMEDEFFTCNMVIYIEKEIAKKFSSNSIISSSKI